jgi:hypothetical protein
MALPPSRHGRQAPQALSIGIPFGWPSAGSLGVVAQGGADAGRAFVSASTSSASGRRPVSGADVQSPRESVHATGVQCPVRASERPGVRCPLWASGVRAFPRPLCPTGVRSWRVAVGQAAAVAGMAGVGVLARRVPDRLVGTGIEAAQAALGQGRRRLGLGRRCGRWWGGG